MSILDLFRLAGRVAVVTGSGRGIGRAIALADAGADVVVTARRAHEVAAVAGEARGRRAVEVAADLRGARRSGSPRPRWTSSAGSTSGSTTPAAPS